MRFFRLSAFVLIAAAATACAGNEDGELITPDPVAGLRYVNLVPDTGAMDFRVIDIVGNAPNQVAASFRTGGAPSGVTTTILPLHAPVRAGTRSIRVFMNGTDPAIASTVMFDTTFTFEANNNYTLYLYGYSRTGSTPALNAIIVKDSVPTLAAGKIGMRLLHLAPTLAPSATTNVDAYVVVSTAAAPLAGTPAFANRAMSDLSAYVALDTTATAATLYKVAVTATGTNTPILFSANLPAGTRGTSTTNPLPGTYVVGSAFTAVLVPQSVTGSAATSFTTPSVIYMVDQLPPRTAP